MNGVQKIFGRVAHVSLIVIGFIILCFGVFSRTPWSPQGGDAGTVHADVPAPPSGDSAGGGGDCGADSGSC